MHFTTSPHRYFTTCIEVLFHRLKIQPLHGITTVAVVVVLFKLIIVQGHQNTTIIAKGTINYRI